MDEYLNTFQSAVLAQWGYKSCRARRVVALCKGQNCLVCSWKWRKEERWKRERKRRKLEIHERNEKKRRKKEIQINKTRKK